MDKFTNEVNTLKLQMVARQAAREEICMEDAFLEGRVAEEDVLFATENLRIAVEHAVSGGVSRKDLPLV